MGDRSRGLYTKFLIERVDGEHLAGGKHAGCYYFVLDLDHDKHAIPAIAAYARSALKDGYRDLAADLFMRASNGGVKLRPKEIAMVTRRMEEEASDGN